MRSNPQNEIRQSPINISRRCHSYYSILEIEGFYEDKKPHQLVDRFDNPGEIDTICKDIGLNRSNLFRKNLKAWLLKVELPYRSPHKFRHGHVHYGQAHSKTQEDYKAISQKVMHSTTGITDKFYSNMDDEMKKSRIDLMFQ